MIDNIDYAEDVETLLKMSKSQVEHHLQSSERIVVADSRQSMTYFTIEDHISKSSHLLL